MNILLFASSLREGSYCLGGDEGEDYKHSLAINDDGYDDKQRAMFLLDIDITVRTYVVVHITEKWSFTDRESRLGQSGLGGRRG